MIQINPIEEAINFLNKYDYELLSLAKRGIHIYNPYHNLNHCLLVVYHSLNAFCYNRLFWDQSDIDIKALSIASLFHDHDHSGGKTNDHDNILRACHTINIIFQGADTSYINKTVKELITVTEFSNGKFIHEPITFIEKCIRDADLCSIYTEEGRVLLSRLPEELGLKFDLEFIEKTRNFLTSVTMYTDYGKALQKYHLDRAIDKLTDLLSDEYCNA